MANVNNDLRDDGDIAAEPSAWLDATQFLQRLKPSMHLRV